MIELCDVSVAFDGQPVLTHFSATIQLTGNTAVYGASGAGKTTLLRLLSGLQKPDSGRIDGLDSLRISAVFQEDRLLPWLSALENVSLVSDAQTAQALLDRLGLGKDAGELPAQLSGGMKRRVAIARALAFPCDLLLLDEPFNGLDAETKRETANAILAKNCPVVVVTHNREEADLLQVDESIQL